MKQVENVFLRHQWGLQTSHVSPFCHDVIIVSCNPGFCDIKQPGVFLSYPNASSFLPFEDLDENSVFLQMHSWRTIMCFTLVRKVCL